MSNRLSLRCQIFCECDLFTARSVRHDYQAAPENELGRFLYCLSTFRLPERRSVSVTFKSTKPVQAYTLDLSAVQAHLQPTRSGSSQGKALADGKLLREYAVKDGDTINLMVKPGFDWDPSKTSAPAPVSLPPPIASPVPEPKTTRGGHGRIPSVVLSPSPSLTPSPGEVLVDIPLVLDTSNIPADAATRMGRLLLREQGNLSVSEIAKIRDAVG
ncbi:hypothetical protein C8T65DRAFT_637898, partial [Cerioporus squamosus]